ncbi:MAG: family 78 glycoside hydrolase catalytic domain [Clostridia bacterium]|nr:family 78 glycoside hydrolase catalytic domain [Clostridia bacterium]
MNYAVKTKEKWNALPICGSDEFLKTTEDIKGVEGADFIWGYFYTRNLLRKNFNIKSGIKKATAHFICDNSFDIYFNKAEAAVDVKEFKADVTHLLKTGENSVSIRAFQTNDESYFTSAICGEVVVETEDETLRVVTNDSWLHFHPVNFGRNDEPLNWMEDDNLRSCWLWGRKLHPRQIKRSMYMRKGIEIKDEVKSATLSVYAQGEAEMYINGKKVGEEYFSTGISEKYFEYHTFDVAEMLKTGKNAIGAITGNTWLNSESHSGMYMNKNFLLAELKVEYENGETEFFGTDKSWKTAPSPITDNDLQFGERYDARLEIKDWCSIDFDDSDWYYAEEMEENYLKPYAERCYPPVKIQKFAEPVSCENINGAYLYDFGFNCAGRYALTLKNTVAGQRVKISVGEELRRDKSFALKVYAPVFYPEDYKSGGRALAALKNYDIYTCKGGETETYMPRFAFNGFRYLKIEGADITQIADIKQTVMYNDLDFGWKLSSSDPFINEFAKTVERTMQGNLFNGFLDCPTREKNFWTGDIAVFGATACYFADCQQILSRWTDGGRKMCATVYGWGDEIYTIPLEMYQFYGDKGFLKHRLPDILAYARERIKTAKDNILPENPLAPFNDHSNPFNKNLSRNFFGHLFYCYMMKCIAEIAKILGETELETEFKERFKVTKAEFNKLYYLADEKDYSEHLQSGIILPIALDIAEEKEKAALAATLNEYILKEGCLTTGFWGTRYIMQVLSDYGYTDTVFMLLQNDKFPSWRDILKSGATTITETWRGMSGDDDGATSKNHFAYGVVVGFMFEYLGGIRYRESDPGFEVLQLQPTFIKQMGDFSCEYKSVKGKIKTAWKFEGDTVTYDFDVPVPTRLKLPNGTSMIYQPGKHSIICKI